MTPSPSRFSAGYGERLITPPMGVDLSGYGFYLDRKAGAVLDDLKVRAVHLADGRQAVFLIGCDLIGLSIEFSDTLRAGIAAAHRLPSSHVLLACSHTHSGPATQGLRGLGRPSAAYMKMLAARILEAAGEAAENAAPASLRTAFEAVEPIGYNRRTNDFCGVDPWLKAAVLRTRAERIYLLNYACHAVVLGRGNGVSADWPGAWVREMEKSGRRAVFLQGFCGDIDPVTQINRWGKGTPEDLRFNGELLKRRLDKAERFAETQERPRLSAVEKRIRIPLDVWGKGEIERRAASFGKTFARFPGARRFAREWKAVALQKRPGLRKSPFLEGVPIQALAIGGLKMIALPGEIFCGIGLKLRKAFDPLIPVGLANGDIGYVPSRRAYEDRSDYACYCAPMFGPGFPFAPDIEGIILRVSRKMLRAV